MTVMAFSLTVQLKDFCVPITEKMTFVEGLFGLNPKCKYKKTLIAVLYGVIKALRLFITGKDSSRIMKIDSVDLFI